MRTGAILGWPPGSAMSTTIRELSIYIEVFREKNGGKECDRMTGEEIYNKAKGILGEPIQNIEEVYQRCLKKNLKSS